MSINPFDPGFYHEEELRSFGFGAVGKNVAIAKNCTIIGLPNIYLGDNVRIDGYTTIVATAEEVVIGSYIHIGGGCHLSGAGGIVMEDFSGLSQGVKIYSISDDYTGHHLTNPCVPKEYLGAHRKRVTLGRHAIVGAGSVILPGASLGEGVAVGALSLVTKPLSAWGVYSGSPARRIKARSRALLQAEAELLGQPYSACPSGATAAA